MLSHEFVRAFAELRNKGLSFSFLKENGELLSIAVSSGMLLEPKSVDLYKDFYKNIENLWELYPQFYRFFLAIILDLEALGMRGNMGEKLSDYVLEHDLYAHETSDTRRLEILNLLARTGREPKFHSDRREALHDRVQGFFGNPDRFLKFNKPLFYDLTHIVFFWTNYGEHKMEKSENLIQSLTHIGLLAFLDDDPDLLSEVCLCFKFLDADVPTAWEEACSKAANDIYIDYQKVQSTAGRPPADEYHIYFVLHWWFRISGKAAFTEDVKTGMPIFCKRDKPKSALAELSHKLHPMLLSRNAIKIAPSVNVNSFLSEIQQDKIALARSSSPHASSFLQKLTHGYISLA